MSTVFACGRSNSGGNKPVFLKLPKESLKRETAAAYGFDLNDAEGAALVWLPKSQLTDYREEGEDIFFWVPAWLVENKSLEYFIDTSYAPSLFD